MRKYCFGPSLSCHKKVLIIEAGLLLLWAGGGGLYTCTFGDLPRKGGTLSNSCRKKKASR